MVTLPTAAAAEILADLGFDWLFLDAEHSGLSYGDIQSILQAVSDRVACVVRLPPPRRCRSRGCSTWGSRHYRAAG